MITHFRISISDLKVGLKRVFDLDLMRGSKFDKTHPFGGMQISNVDYTLFVLH